jgi:hypothetical protein
MTRLVEEQMPRIEITCRSAANALCECCKANDEECYQVLSVCEECLLKKAMDDFDSTTISVTTDSGRKPS